MESKETINLNLEINCQDKKVLFRAENCSAEEYEYENEEDFGLCVAEYVKEHFYRRIG